jgi:hypothetical protein
VAAGQGSCEVTSAAQRFRYAATGRWAVSIRTYLVLVFPFGFLTSIEREQLLNGVGLTRAATIAFAGELSASLYLFLAQLFILGDRKTKLQPLSRCLFVWVSTGLVRGGFTAIYARWAFGYQLDLPIRLPAAILFTAGAMAVTAFYFGTIERRRLETQALHSLGGVLHQERSHLNEIEVEKRRQVLSVFEAQLLPQVSALRSGIQKLLVGQDKTNEHGLHQLLTQSQEISKAINQQKLEYEGGSKNNSGDYDPESQVPYWSQLIPKIISIRLTFLVMVLGGASGQFPRNGIKGIAAAIIGAIFVVSILAPISMLMKRYPAHRNYLLPMGFAAAFSVQYVFNLLQPTLGFHLNNPYAPWYSGLKSVYGVYVASVIASLMIKTGREFEGANIKGSKLRDAIHLLSLRSEVIDQSLFDTRFGTLQGKIAGVTMALHLMETESLGQISSSRKKELLESANELLGESMRTIESLTLKAL